MTRRNLSYRLSSNRTLLCVVPFASNLNPNSTTEYWLIDGVFVTASTTPWIISTSLAWGFDSPTWWRKFGSSGHPWLSLQKLGSTENWLVSKLARETSEKKGGCTGYIRRHRTIRCVDCLFRERSAPGKALSLTHVAVISSWHILDVEPLF